MNKNQLKDQISYYGQDLAYVHDKGYGQLAEKAALLIDELMSRIEEKEKISIVDLGCGTGILASELSAKKYKVTGIDYSGDMLSIARQKAPEATFIQTSIWNYEIPSCHVVSSIGECLCYLFDNDPGLTGLEKLFINVYNGLEPDGYFIFDILTPAIWEINQEKIKYAEEEEYSIIIRISPEDNHQIIRREIILFLKEGGSYKKSVEVHRQRLFDEEAIEHVLRNIGLEVKIINRYKDQVFRKGHVGFICRKKSEMNYSL